MIFWLDHPIFGNGHGMATPYWNGRFYWLSGELYKFNAWFGAQLTSIQWTHPRPGERRRLSGRDYRVFNSERRWGRVMVSWQLVDLPPHDIYAADAMLREVEAELGKALP